MNDWMCGFNWHVEPSALESLPYYFLIYYIFHQMGFITLHASSSDGLTCTVVDMR